MVKNIFNPNSSRYWDEKYNDQEKNGIVRSDGTDLDKFMSYFRRSKTILDFGAGRGGNVQYLSGILNDKKFLLVDHSRVCLKQCREKFGENSSPNVYEYYEQLTDISESSIDMIMTIEVLEHIENYDEVLKLLWDRLSVNGALLVSVPVKGWRDRHREHINKFTVKSMFEKLAELSEIVHISPRSYSKRSGILSTAYFLVEKKAYVR